MYICAIFGHIIENVIKKCHIEHDKSPIKDRFDNLYHLMANGLQIKSLFVTKRWGHNSHSPSTKIPFQRNIHYAYNFGA
jgi:hypothetical protein